jgi:biotin operon repressor
MSQKELAEILGKSDSWVSKKVTMLQDERLNLVQGDNHAGELSA